MREFGGFCGDAALLLLFGALLFLAGCATSRDTGAAAPTKVEVPVAVSCLPADLPPEPTAATNAELKAMTPRSRYLRIAADREAELSWRAKVAPALSACR